MTSPVGGYYYKTGFPTLTATTQRIVRYTIPPNVGVLIARGKLELLVLAFPNERYVAEFSIMTDPSTHDESVTLTHGSSTATGLIPPFVNNIILTSNPVAGWAEVSITFGANPANLPMAATLFWYPMSLPTTTPSSGGVFFAEAIPVLGWAAQTSSPTNTLSLSTNNGTHCYTFACKNTFSASQTNFV